MTRQEKINKVARFCAATDCGNCKAEHMCADIGYGTIFFRWSEASETTLDAMLAAIDAADKPTEQQPVTRATILDTAKKCVVGDRQDDYGSPENSFSEIGKLWSAYLGADIKAADVGLMMALFKVARIKQGRFKEDSFIDAAGYIACAGEISGGNNA